MTMILLVAAGVFLGGLALRFWEPILAVLWMGVLLGLCLLELLLAYGWIVSHGYR